MGIVAQLPYIFHGVSCCLTCPELRSGYIHSIGTAVYGRDADTYVSCRSKQFKMSHLFLEDFELLLCARAELRVRSYLLVVLDSLCIVA